jgi:hypothetical protein
MGPLHYIQRSETGTRSGTWKAGNEKFSPIRRLIYDKLGRLLWALGDENSFLKYLNKN